MFRFANPEYLFLLLLLPLLAVMFWRRRGRLGGQMKFSTLKHLKNVPVSFRQRLRRLFPMLRLGVLALLILGLARPQSGSRQDEVITEGIDIVMVLDVSSSMLAEDFKPENRLGAAKEVAREFIEGRRNDPIGLVIFGGEAFSQCPLTLDYGVLVQILEQTDIAGNEWDGTAIGNGLATAVDRLKNSRAQSKVIILLTDGENNAGEVDPITAAQVAQTFDIRTYTVGVGSRGTAPVPRVDPLFGKRYIQVPVSIDEDLLKRIAATTGGQYFRATNTDKLREIYQQIDQLEKTRIEVKEFTTYTELFIYYAGAGLLLLVVELLLGNTYLRKLP
ncbi:MAG: VWA domain-containing protein [Calditrichaeota bacterium]|nr:VWA domain-containing protein [Calditrichota bacterium]MCB9087702.1 VWA domain-containing protein [Calditrichia bacterium]